MAKQQRPSRDLGAQRDAVIGNGVVGNPGPSWEVIATGDFYGDGHSDILWQNDNGQVAIWELNGTSVIASAAPGNPGPSWHAVATGDFNGDGTSDFFFRTATGRSPSGG